ncbi:hypothetical protein D3C71_1822980 [compost metagenome]
MVQALYWLKDSLDTAKQLILNKLAKILTDPLHGEAIQKDLVEGSRYFQVGCKT